MGWEGWLDALPLKQFLGTLDERGGSLLGELSWARMSPATWLPSGSSAKPSPSRSNGGSSMDFTSAAVATVASVGAAVAAGFVVKSYVDMSTWKRRLRDAESNESAYGPKPIPLLGNLLELRNGYYETMYKFVDKPAAVFWVLSTPFVVVSDAECVRKVLGGAGGLYMKPKYFGYRFRPVEKAMAAERENVAAESATYDPHADSSRVALNSMVESSFGTIRSSMDRLVGMMADAADRIEVEENQAESLSIVRSALVSLNLDVLFGVSQEVTQASRAADMVGGAGEEFARRMVNPLKILVDIPGNLKYLRDVGGLIGLGRQLCAKLDEVAVAFKDGAQELSAAAKESLASGGSGLTWVHAWVGKVGKVGKLGKVVGLLMASSQTVPITAVWMLHLVAKHGDVREQLQRELRDLGVEGVTDLTFELMDKMPRAEAVIRETLRLYPPFPLIQREAQADDVLGGITISQGTKVYIVPWLVHRNPKLWPSPHEFKPSRFSKGSASHGDAPSDWAYLPFGRGPRMCAGSQLAMVELKVLLSLALLRLDWEKTTTKNGDKEEDSIFPDLGMLPRRVQLFCKRVEKEMKLDDAL